MTIYTEQIENSNVLKVVAETKSGVLVELLSIGAGIRRVAVREGDSYATLTQSFTDLNEYIEKNTAYCGKTLAPNAGRFYVSEGIDLGSGNIIHPEANERGINSLHGSSRSVSIENWKLERATIKDGQAKITFFVSQPDGLCGWPGNRHYIVAYTLSEDGSLLIELSATTDMPTYINMSNHAYWNLNLDSSLAMQQIISINACGVVYNDCESIPCKMVSTENILASDGIDFSSENLLSDLIPMDTGTEYSAQMRKGCGLNNAFVFSKHRLSDCLCRLSSTNRRHSVEMFSDAPAMVLYSSGSMAEGLNLENGQISCSSCSAAFEFQEMPSLGNTSITLPENPFRRSIIFKIK